MLHKEFGYIFAGVSYMIFGSFIYMGWELSNMRSRSYKINDNETMKELLDEVYDKKINQDVPLPLSNINQKDIKLIRSNKEYNLEPDIQLKISKKSVAY